LRRKFAQTQVSCVERETKSHLRHSTANLRCGNAFVSQVRIGVAQPSVGASCTLQDAFSTPLRHRATKAKKYIHLKSSRHNSHSNMLLYLYFILLARSSKQCDDDLVKNVEFHRQSAPVNAKTKRLFLHRIIFLLLEIIVVFVVLIAILR